MPAFETHPTPNPNSVKITTDAESFIESGMAAFNSAQEAAGHPLGERLFAVPGVANVFVLPQFVTVTRHPAATWDALLPAVEEALRAYFAAR